MDLPSRSSTYTTFTPQRTATWRKFSSCVAPFLDEFSDAQGLQQAALAETAQLGYYFLGISLRAYRREDSHRSSVLRDDDPLAACYFLQGLEELGKV